MIFEGLVDVTDDPAVSGNNPLAIPAGHEVKHPIEMRPRPIGALTVARLRLHQKSAADTRPVALVNDGNARMNGDRVLGVHPDVTAQPAAVGTRTTGCGV
jgi:hypothetical protein